MAENSRSEADVNRTLVRGNIDRVFQARDCCKLLTERCPAAVQPLHALDARCDKVKWISRNIFKSRCVCLLVHISKFEMGTLESVERRNEGSFAAFHAILPRCADDQLIIFVIREGRSKARAGIFKSKSSRLIDKKYYYREALSASGEWISQRGSPPLANNTSGRRALQFGSPVVVGPSMLGRTMTAHVGLAADIQRGSEAKQQDQGQGDGVWMPARSMNTKAPEREAGRKDKGYQQVVRHQGAHCATRLSWHSGKVTIAGRSQQTTGRTIEDMPLVLAEVEGRLWRSRQPMRSYPAGRSGRPPANENSASAGSIGIARAA